MPKELERLLGPRALLRAQFRFTLLRSQRAYRLNRFLMEMSNSSAGWDMEAAMERHMLSCTENFLLKQCDFEELIEYGASVILLANAANKFGMTFLEMGLRQRGQTLEQFLMTKPSYK